MSARRTAAVLVLVLALGLAGCAVTDPLEREGLWRPTGVNEANLRLMIAVPSDLVQGAAAHTADGEGAARAVRRLQRGRVKPLPDVGISKIAPGSGAAGLPAPAASALPGDD